MIADLPATRAEATAFYAAIKEESQTGHAWREAQRWLGRHDLFYLLTRLLHRPDADHDWLFARCREVQANPDNHLDLWAREHYKLQRLDEPTPTPDGWKFHGDLVPGDKLFGADGRVIEVVALNPIVEDSPAYELEFDDGVKIQAGAEHLWSVERRCRRRIPGTFAMDGIGKRVYRETVILKTEDIAHHDHRPDNRLAIPVSPPLALPEIELPIDPYVLGCWLGDGTSSNGDITCGDKELFARIVARGHEIGRDKDERPTCSLHRVIGLCQALRKADLLNNKHIPPQYLRASIEQRLELLRGLMDTDGSCDPRGTATFANTNYLLALQVAELCNTLGLKPNLRPVNGLYNGEPYLSYHVSFQAYRDMAPFAIPRKVMRCKKGDRPNPRRYIVACRPVPPAPMRCIQVSAKDGLYLTGQAMVPTHNSTIITFALTIQDILNDPEITIGIFSHTRRIAKGFLEQIMREFELNDDLKLLYPDVLWDDPKKQSQKWSLDDGIVVRRKGNPKEPTIEASGLVDSQPTGRHYRLRIYDDVVTRESVSTPDQINKTTDAWSLSENLGVQEEKGGKVRYIGTRYNLHDTYSELLKRGAVTPRLYPATANGRFDGEPVFFSQQEWEKRVRNQSRSTVAAQLLQNPMADEEAVFRNEWLVSYDVRPRTLNVYITGDPSMGRNSGSDNTAMAVIGVSASGVKYLLDGWCHRMPLSERWIKLRDLYRKWSRTPGVQHVAVGYERFGMQSDIEYFEERMLVERTHFPIQELSWTRDGSTSKTDRVSRLEPDFRNGRFYLPMPVVKSGKAMYWKVETDPNLRTFGEIEFREARGLTRRQMDHIKFGSADLVAKALKCIDSEGRIYDLTLAFMEEYSSFPFGRLKDLIDAVSRIYDMAPTGPTLTSQEMSEPTTFFDS